MCRRETKGHGLVLGLGRSGGWWDFVSLKVFSSLDDSMNYLLVHQLQPQLRQVITGKNCLYYNYYLRISVVGLCICYHQHEACTVRGRSAEILVCSCNAAGKCYPENLLVKAHKINFPVLFCLPRMIIQEKELCALSITKCRHKVFSELLKYLLKKKKSTQQQKHSLYLISC